MEKGYKQKTARRGRGRRRTAGFTIIEVLVSIAALSLGLAAAFAAQLSSVSLSNVARESELATFGSGSAMEMVTARPFVEMIDPDPVMGSVDTDELAALQPPFDPRGFATYAAKTSTYPDAPMTDYVGQNATLYNKVMLYGSRIWEPVGAKTTKIDPATNVSYTLYPMGSLQKPKVLVWFEPRPTLLSGVAGSYQSSILKKNSLGYPALVPALSDSTDVSTGQPTTVVTAIGWYPVKMSHDSTATANFNPLALFVPPSDGSGTFAGSDITALKAIRDGLIAKGLQIQYNRTVMRP